MTVPCLWLLLLYCVLLELISACYRCSYRLTKATLAPPSPLPLPLPPPAFKSHFVRRYFPVGSRRWNADRLHIVKRKRRIEPLAPVLWLSGSSAPEQNLPPFDATALEQNMNNDNNNNKKQSNNDNNDKNNGNNDKDDEEDMENRVKAVMLSWIQWYRSTLSPIMPPNCRYFPSCSKYAIQAIEEFGPLKGGILTAWRLARCNPVGGSGYDPPEWPPPNYFRKNYQPPL